MRSYKIAKNAMAMVGFALSLAACGATNSQHPQNPKASLRNGLATLIDVGAAVGAGAMGARGNAPGAAAAIGAGGIGQQLLGNQERANGYYKAGQAYTDAVARGNQQAQSPSQENSQSASSDQCTPHEVKCSGPCKYPPCPDE